MHVHAFPDEFHGLLHNFIFRFLMPIGKLPAPNETEPKSCIKQKGLEKLIRNSDKLLFITAGDCLRTGNWLGCFFVVSLFLCFVYNASSTAG
jgi:hypothetical protein